MTMSVTELMNQAGDALRHEDVDTLLELLNMVEQWLQTDDELESQRNMLESMLEVLER